MSATLLALSIVMSLQAANLPRQEQGLPSPSTKKIKVRLAHNMKTLDVRGFDLRILDSVSMRLQQYGTATWTLDCKKNGIFAKKNDGTAEIQLKSPLKIDSPSGIIQAKGQPIRDGLTFILSPGGCDIVQEMDFESYVEASVAEENTQGWTSNVLDAKVIVARSMAYHTWLKSKEQPNPIFDLDSPTLLSLESSSRYQEDFRIAGSIQRTQGQVLTVGPKEALEVVQGLSHPQCAGRTELPQNVWGNPLPGYKNSIQCPFCMTSLPETWKTEIREKELVNTMLHGINITGTPGNWPSDWNRWFTKARLIRVQSQKLDESNRITSVILTFAFSLTAQMEFEVSGTMFRNWIGMDKIQSMLFNVASESIHSTENRFWFEGKGRGHGVGLCLAGAKSMAATGLGAANILKHYFPEAEIRKL